MKAFEDENIFEYAAVYRDLEGKKWLRETRGDFYKFFEYNREAYIFCGEMLRFEDDDIKSAHERFLAD